LHEDGRDIVRVRCCVKTCSEIHAIAWSGNGRARHGGLALILSSISAFSAVPASFEVLLGLKSEYCQRLASACRRGSFCAAVAAVERAETVPTLVLRETCGGGGGGGRRERRRDHLHADGGIAVLVVRLMTVLDVVVTLRVLLRRDVASERVESEASTTP
jgi:hypothetical protein